MVVNRSIGGSGGGVRTTHALLYMTAAIISLQMQAVQTFQPVSLSPLQQQRLLPALQAAQSTTSLQSTSSTLSAISTTQKFIIDGGELQSFLLHNKNSGGATISSGGAPRFVSAGSARRSGNAPQVGCLTLVTGTSNDGDRIIAVQKTDSDDDDDETGYETVPLGNGNVEVYTHTIANIPNKVSDGDALSTAAAALVGIHSAIPRVEMLGGSENEVFYSGKAVVMGGNDYAIFLADGLATLGIETSLVSNGGAKTKTNQVNVLSPSVDIGDDEEEVGFTTAIGQFDSLIDTIANEQKGVIITNENPAGKSTVLQLLRSRHKCDKYISTLTESQQIVKNDGVLFGPGKANSYAKSLESISSNKCIPLIPSAGFGQSTLQILLENNILFSSKNGDKATAVRGWVLKDFWEETSWPRDSSGTGLRFGLPVMEDEDLDEQFLIERSELENGRRIRVGGEGGMDEKEVQGVSKVDEKNPYVTHIVGVDGLAENIISKQRTSVVFVAMRSCRTCKGINPVFTRLARERSADGGDLLFAKADASGPIGKALGRQLGLVAVPSFVLFRNGVRYGAVSTSKLPSERLNKAIRDLESGEEFDTSLEEEDEED